MTNVIPTARRGRRIISDDEALVMLDKIAHWTSEIGDLVDLLERWADQSEDWDEQDRRMSAVASIDESIVFREYDLSFVIGRLRKEILDA